MWLSVQAPLAGESGVILGVLLFILAISIATFTVTTRRATIRARELQIRQWARLHGAALLEPSQLVRTPPHLAILEPYRPSVKRALSGPIWTMAELTTIGPAEAKGKTPRWRLLAYRLPDTSPPWPATGLRPAAHVVSLTDLFGLSSFPSISFGDQFMIFGAESAAAQALADSSVQTMLPPDIGLLLTDRQLLLDFSSRRFEIGQWQQVLAIAEPLAEKLAKMGAAS
ncbi:MAG TPA: hypothetical protein VL992_02750 [Tepidisphaeraceae bacterium]|nr:hypothetical protein [Tepidisphaeraceae bacterium]